MAKIVVLGAGIGGISQVYELHKEHEIFLVGDSDHFEFTPSNPWVAVGWRKGEQIKVDLPDLMAKYGIGFSGVGARRLHPAENRLELNDDTNIQYGYLIIATGPKLAFEEVDGLVHVAHRAAEGAVVDVGVLGEDPFSQLLEALLVDEVRVAVEQVLDLQAVGDLLQRERHGTSASGKPGLRQPA